MDGVASSRGNKTVQSNEAANTILLLVDCEPDPRETTPGVPMPWSGFEGFHDFLSSWRGRISEKTQSNASFAWFWRADPQIELTYNDAGWPFRTYEKQIEQSAKHGDAFGLHTHPWRWDSAVNRWIADFGNPQWVETCVRSSFDIFERYFGRPMSIVSIWRWLARQFHVRAHREIGRPD